MVVDVDVVVNRRNNVAGVHEATRAAVAAGAASTTDDGVDHDIKTTTK